MANVYSKNLNPNSNEDKLVKIEPESTHSEVSTTTYITPEEYAKQSKYLF